MHDIWYTQRGREASVYVDWHSRTDAPDAYVARDREIARMFLEQHGVEVHKPGTHYQVFRNVGSWLAADGTFSPVDGESATFADYDDALIAAVEAIKALAAREGEGK